MEANCGICEEVLGDRPRTELLCHHFFHTECVLANLAVREHGEHNLTLLRCITCDHYVFPQREELEEIGIEDHGSVESYEEEQNVNMLYNTNETFRNHIKKYVAAIRERSKPKAAFRKVCAAKKTEILPRYKQIKEHVEALHNVKKDELLQSDEYKAYKKIDAKCARYYNLLRREYNVRGKDLRRLSTRPGLRSLEGGSRRYWHDSPTYIIRHALRFRHRCY